MSQLLQISSYGNGIDFQIPEWDLKSASNSTTPSRSFLRKSPRDAYTVELKRELVENDRRLKTTMQSHRHSMMKERKSMEQAIRKNSKPFICFRGNIYSRYGETYNKLPSSLNLPRQTTCISLPNFSDVEAVSGAPMTVVNDETVLSEQYVVCERCKKTYKESSNRPDSCRYHQGPVIGVFGGMCQTCGRLDYTSGCFKGYHTRKRKGTVPRNTKKEK